MKQISIFMLCLLMAMACSSPQKKVNENQEAPANTPTELKAKEVQLAVTEVSYNAGGAQLTGYMAHDASLEGKRPGVLVVHEWWGHNDYARKRADMLAELGFVAFAVDMYGDGKLATHPDDAGKFMNEVMQNLDAGTARFKAAMEQLKANPHVDPDKIAAIGYCFGGSVVLSMANAGLDLDAVAAFHSSVQVPIAPEAGKVKAKILVCNGADDPFIQPETVTAFKATMDNAGADYKYVSYEGATHSFTNPEATDKGKEFKLPLAYNEAADKASWDELQTLLASAFK